MLSVAEVTGALGGDKVLGKKIESSLDILDAIQDGLPSKSVFFLQKLIGLGDSEYSTTLGVSSKWLGRHRKTPKPHLGVDISDRLYRIARIYKLAEEVLENKEAAIHWLHRHQMGFNGRTPMDLMRTEIGAKEVEELLYRMEYSIYA